MPSILGGALLRSPNLPELDNRLGVEDVVDVEPQLQASRELKTGQIALIVVCSVLITAAIVVLTVWWIYRRRLRKKTNAVESAAHPAAVQQLSTNGSVNNNEVLKVNGVGGQPPNSALRTVSEEFCDAMTEYGSIAESFPPSPTLSFRSVIEGPGFNRSRAGTGTSFGTVASFASFASDRTSRSRTSTVASYKTCYENDTF